MKRCLLTGLCTLLILPHAVAQNAPGAQPSRQLLLSRSTDENGQTAQTGNPMIVPASAEPSASDAERLALTFTDFDLDLRLDTAAQKLNIRALVTVRNDGAVPLSRIPLQISSSLNWERIRLRGRAVDFPVSTLNSDVDHTGQLHEAAVPLPTPLAPGSTLQLDLAYSGAAARSAQRLLAIGTPLDAALHSDWDQIGVDFTGLRGFGNVAWYPVSAPPVLLGDGARLFDLIGEHKRRMAGARFHLRLTAEFPHGQAPTVAMVNGHSVALEVTDRQTAGEEVSGVAIADSGVLTLGFDAPSFFLAIRTPLPIQNATLWTLPENSGNAPAWSNAANAVTPFLQRWLGLRPRAQLTLLDLPDGQCSPFETGAMLATSIRQTTPDQLNGILAHALAHAWVQSPRAWLSEGVAHFLGTLWIERQSGRSQALAALDSGRAALALAEPETPGQSAGQPLAQAISPVYYRTKAAYVLWMLRDVAGDEALSAALRAYTPAADFPSQNPAAPRSSGTFQKLLEQSGTRHDLSTFFSEWVDNDHGLPDLTIESTFSSPTTAGNFLVTANAANNGSVAAEVPVTARNELNSVTQRILIPAHGKASQRLLLQGRPTEVQLNDGTVPETEATIHIRKLDE